MSALRSPPANSPGRTAVFWHRGTMTSTWGAAGKAADFPRCRSCGRWSASLCREVRGRLRRWMTGPRSFGQGRRAIGLRFRALYRRQYQDPPPPPSRRSTRTFRSIVPTVHLLLASGPQDGRKPLGRLPQMETRSDVVGGHPATGPQPESVIEHQGWFCRDSGSKCQEGM